jgi:hypothetical protein
VSIQEQPESLSVLLSNVSAVLDERLTKLRADAEAAREDAEAVKELRVAIQRKVDEIERTHNSAAQNVARIVSEYERLSTLRERAANAMALKPPDLPQAPRRAIRAIKDIPRLRQELLAASAPIQTEKPICGIYFLLDEREVVYVGQSVNIISRIATHVTEGAKQFNRWCYITVERARLTELESFYITLLRPSLNKVGKPALLAGNDPVLGSEVA